MEDGQIKKDSFFVFKNIFLNAFRTVQNFIQKYFSNQITGQWALNLNREGTQLAKLKGQYCVL